MRRIRISKQSTRDEVRLLKEAIGHFQSVLTEKPEKSSPLHFVVVDAPWPQCLPVHLGANTKVGVDVVSPNKLR